MSENHYRKIALGYDKSHTDVFFSAINDFEVGCVARLVDGGASIVEVGCGTGLILERLRALGYYPSGVEPCVKMAVLAMMKGFSVRIDSAESLACGLESFDVVCCFKAFPHFDDAERALLEFAYVAEKFVVVEFYNRHSLMFLWRKLFPKPVKTEYYSLGEFKRLFPHNLNIIRVDGKMVFTPSNVFSNPVTRLLERACPGWIKKRFGSHVVVTCEKEKK